jgi:hypothetical protein
MNERKEGRKEGRKITKRKINAHANLNEKAYILKPISISM